LLGELRTTLAGSETRRLLVIELSELLTAEAANKRVVNEFLDAEGPEIVYDISSSMRVRLSPSQPYPTLALARTPTLAVALAPTLSLTLALTLTLGELDGRREEWHDEQAE